MGIALAEKTVEERNRYAVEFYEVMSAMYYTPSSPTLYHAGLMKPQLSSCFLSTVPDDLHMIFNEYGDSAQLLKYAGGIGADWTPVRATGSIIKTTGVESQGVIPFLKVANDVTISINRSGRRRGAAAVYLEYWHARYRGFLRAAQKHRRRASPRPRPQHRGVDTRPFYEAPAGRRLLDALLAFGRPRPPRRLWPQVRASSTTIMKKWPRRDKFLTTKKSAPPICGRRTSPCCLRPATRGLPGRIRQISARRRTTSASCTQATSAPR